MKTLHKNQVLNIFPQIFFLLVFCNKRSRNNHDAYLM